jgi:hypothetical protein
MSTFAIYACAAVLGAQSPTQGAPGAASPQAPARSAAQAAQPVNLSVEGCVQRGPLAPSTPSGAVGTTGSAASFILASASKPVGTSGAADASSVAIAKTYRLDAEDSKLSPHVGHKVEITGTVDSAMERSSGPATSPDAPLAGISNAPKLKVDTVKMIATNCAP